MIAAAELTAIRRQVLGWYAVERRDFPWRGLRDPYEVMVSEVMLQQTQASRVAERFPAFLRRFPNVTTLASADPGDVLTEWVGLGYNRRALALQRAAATIATDGWPTDVDALQRLPGIGPYTARAIASLSFDRPVGVVDTNVRRWLVRRLGVTDAPSELQAVADALAGPGRGTEVADWTHASMEIGATVCQARRPRCSACPLAKGCPSRSATARVAPTRQPKLAGSDRVVRGAIVRALAEAQDRRVPEAELRAGIATGMGDDRWHRVVAGLERDGLVRRDDAVLHLGAITIGA